MIQESASAAVLALGLGMALSLRLRHGLDSAHLLAIDAMTRLQSPRPLRLARCCGLCLALKRPNMSLVRGMGWSLAMALCTGLAQAQTSTRWVEGLAVVGEIPVSLLHAATPPSASPPVTAKSAHACLSELALRRQQLEQASLPTAQAETSGATAAATRPKSFSRPGPTQAQADTLRGLDNEIRTVCEETALLKDAPPDGRNSPQGLSGRAPAGAAAPSDQRALYTLEVQADQDEQSLNGMLALRQSTQAQLRQLQGKLPVDIGAAPALPASPINAADDPWDTLIAETRLALAGHQMQKLQTLDALLARQSAAKTQALEALHVRLKAWRDKVPFKPEEMALIRTGLEERIRQLTLLRDEAVSPPEASPEQAEARAANSQLQPRFWSQFLRQTQIDLYRRNLLAWEWRFELSRPHPDGLGTLSARLTRQSQDLQTLERSVSLLLDSVSKTHAVPEKSSAARQNGSPQSELLATLTLLNETRQNMRILGAELQHRLEAMNPLRRAWDQVQQSISTWTREIWDFNLLTLNEKLTVNGQDITTTQNVTVGKSIGAVLVLLIGYLAGSWALRLMRLGLVNVLGVQEAMAARLYLTAKVVMVAALVVLAMSLVNIPLSVFSLLGGVLAVGLGFGAQNLLKNLIGALILQLTHPVKLGDFIVLHQHSGFVKSMGWQFCVVRGFDGDETIIPNVDMLSGSLVNWTFKDLQMRRSISVGVAYGSPVEKTMALLVAAAEQAQFVLKDPKPVVYFSDFGDSSLVFQLKFWVELKTLNPYLIDTGVRVRINEALNAANITMAFPQRDLHLYQTEPLRVDVRQK